MMMDSIVNWSEIGKYLAFWGPGALIACVIIISLSKLSAKIIDKWLGGIIALGTDFISAQKAQAESLAKMAQGAEGLRVCIDNFVNRDDRDHREITILLKYIAGKVDAIEERANGS
jgi:hypothetical protein